MITRRQVLQQSQWTTSQLVRHSLCDSQNYPVMKQVGKNVWQITCGEQGEFSIAMRNVPYKEIYSSYSTERLFNFRMIDGALIQMLYEFQDDELLRHRLAFFPSPDLEEYQSAPDVYESDEIYADILRREIVPFPLRFDYEASNEMHVLIHHPKSHLSLGQYKNCRIPVSGPLTPYLFMNFILQNFYNTAYKKFSNLLKLEGDCFQDSIIGAEVHIPHLRLPNSPRRSLMQKLGFS